MGGSKGEDLQRACGEDNDGEGAARTVEDEGDGEREYHLTHGCGYDKERRHLPSYGDDSLCKPARSRWVFVVVGCGGGGGGGGGVVVGDGGSGWGGGLGVWGSWLW